jgi:hypothetical protein
VNQTPGRPPYPPEHNVWQFPPPPVSRRWFWVAIAAMTGSVLIAVGLSVTGGVIASKDLPSVIENHQLTTVIGHECRIMTESIESMPVDGTLRQQADILADQNQAVEQMLEAVRMLPDDVRAGDKPTEQWLADWDRLLQARASYAVLLERGYRPSLRIPRDSDGDYIFKRMNRVWLTTDECHVPNELLNPYPENIDGV